ncbi:DNA polymerase delta catalytic subunit-like [Amblyomma americanum]
MPHPNQRNLHSHRISETCTVYVSWRPKVYVLVKEMFKYAKASRKLPKTATYSIQEMCEIVKDELDKRWDKVASRVERVCSMTMTQAVKLDGCGYRTEEDFFIVCRIADRMLYKQFVSSLPVCTTYNGQIDHVVQFIVDIKQCLPWLKLPPLSESCHDTCLYNINATEYYLSEISGIIPVTDDCKVPVPPISAMSIDIECIGSDLGSFPVATSGDPVIQIACVTVKDMRTLQMSGYNNHAPTINGGKYDKHIFVIGECAKLHSNIVELLKKFNLHVAEVDPDIITGYNIIQFDFPYLLQRMATLNERQMLSRHMSSRWSIYTMRHGETARFPLARGDSDGDDVFDDRDIEDAMPIEVAVSNDPNKTGTKSKVQSSMDGFVKSNYIQKSEDATSTEDIADAADGWKKADPFACNTKVNLITPSRVIIDMYQFVKSNLKLRQNSLYAVSKLYLEGETKEGVKYADMYMLHHGGPVDRAKIASYCVQDTVLPLKLMTKLKIMTATCELARATRIPMRYVFGRGQQVKTMSVIAHEADKRNMVYPSKIPFDPNIAYQGATVVSPKTGMHRDPVITLDFASLYPTTICAYNLCFTTCILPGPLSQIAHYTQNVAIATPCPSGTEKSNKAAPTKRASGGKLPAAVKKFINNSKLPKPKKIAQVQGQCKLSFAKTPLKVDYTTRTLVESRVPSQSAELSANPSATTTAVASEPRAPVVHFEGNVIITPTNDRFVNAETRRGILPTVIVGLLNDRRAVKKQQAVETDELMRQILDGRQKALKQVANSLYGLMGAIETGQLPCLPVSRSITAIGRMLIDQTKHYVHECTATHADEMPGLNVTYGDTDCHGGNAAGYSSIDRPAMGSQTC